MAHASISQGMRPALAELSDAVELFLNFARPRGKKLPTRWGLI